MCLVTQSCLTLCSPMDWAHQTPLSLGILQERILEWASMPSSSGSSQPRDQKQVSCIAGRFFTIWVTREAQIVRVHHQGPCKREAEKTDGLRGVSERSWTAEAEIRMRWLDHHNIVIIIQIKWKKNEMIGSQEMPATSGGKGQNLSPGACRRSQPWLTPHDSLWLHPCYSIHTYTHTLTHSHTLTWWGEANAKIQGEDSYLQSQGDSPGQTPLHSLQKTSALGLPWWSSG